MSGGRFRFVLIVLAVFHFSIISIFPEKENILIIDKPGQVNSLNSNTLHSWKIRKADIDIGEFFQNPDFKKQGWYDYKAPGEAIKQVPELKDSSRVYIVKQFYLSEDSSSIPMAINLGLITDRDESYLNGVRIGGYGKFGSNEPQFYDKERIYSIPKSALRYGDVNTLLIHVEKYFPTSMGIEQRNLFIGPEIKLKSEFYQREYSRLLLLVVYLTVGIYFLFLFIRRRRESENLAFGLFILLLFIYQFNRNQLKYNLDLSLLFMKKTEYIVLMLVMPAFLNFIRIYFRRKYSKINLLADIALCLIAGYFLFSNNIVLFNTINTNVVQPIWLIYVVLLFYYLFSEIRKKNRDALLMFAGIIFVIISIFIDILVQRNIIVFPLTMVFVFFFFILSLAIILANRFVRLNEEIENLNEVLEEKVRQRTEDLNQTLHEVRTLKIQQDGDYFLTTLLLHPLSSNLNNSQFISTEIYSDQKKKFFFREKEHELGGDISLTSNISLKGKNYTVFVNGDAMGKSIQGAGGALVLGAVFNSILARTRLKLINDKSPELWLKEAFLDLQSVFESFDGSMYLSAIIGLIDESNGLLYYFNAEHPWLVLYRDGKASFLENELTLRKLGTFDNIQQFSVKVFDLEDGDVLFSGSDGRDDLQLGEDANGRIINEDETLFLRNIEKANGELDGTVKNIENSGKLTDDFSIVRIKYSQVSLGVQSSHSAEVQKLIESGKAECFRGKLQEGLTHFQEGYKLDNKNPALLLLIAKVYYKLQDFENAGKYFDEYLNIKSMQEDIMVYSSISHKMSGNLMKAADVGERVYIRNPNNIRNLINLSDVHRLSGNKKHALFLAEEAVRIEPENDSVKKLGKLLGIVTS